MSKTLTAHERTELKGRIDTLQFALSQPGAVLDSLLSQKGREAVKKLKRMDIEEQIKQAKAELVS
jgi:hypothetical protein